MKPEDRSRFLAAGLLAAAAAIHLVAAYEPEHLENELFFGFFWAVVAIQAALALAVLRSVRGSPAVAIGVNVFLVLLWVVTRVVAVPGEEDPEPIELLGLLAKPVEIAALPLLVRLVGRLPWMARAQAEGA